MVLEMSQAKRCGLKYFVNGKDILKDAEYLYLWTGDGKYRAGVGLSDGDSVQLL